MAWNHKAGTLNTLSNSVSIASIHHLLLHCIRGVGRLGLNGPTYTLITLVLSRKRWYLSSLMHIPWSCCYSHSYFSSHYYRVENTFHTIWTPWNDRLRYNGVCLPEFEAFLASNGILSTLHQPPIYHLASNGLQSVLSRLPKEDWKDHTRKYEKSFSTSGSTLQTISGNRAPVTRYEPTWN